MRRRVVPALARLRRRWRLPLAYTLLLASCESPFAPGVVVVNRVEITPSVLQLAVGATTTIVARVYDDGSALLPNAKVFWSSQNPTVVTVDQAGVVTAVNPGTAQLAASSGGVSHTIAVTVEERPIAIIRITPAAASVPVGGTLPLLAEALDGTGAVLPGRPLTFATDAPDIATVSGTGVVTGIAVGSATISASGEGRTGTATVTVTPPPITSLTVDPDDLTITAGSTGQLTATARDAQGTILTGRPLTWQSSNDAVATVSSSGLVTAIAPGSVTVTVSAPNGGPGGSTPSASLTVTVLLTPVDNAALAPDAATVLVNQSLQFTVTLFGAGGEPLSPAGRHVAWSTGNPAIATVSASGAATGLAVGTTTVTVTVTTPGQSTPVQATAQLSVSNQPVASVVVTPGVAVVHVGGLYARDFSAVAQDADGQPLSGRAILWTSSNLAVAAVDAVTGMVTGVSPGPVQIRATSEGITGIANVTVDLVPATTVALTPPAATLTPPAQVALAAVPRDSAGNVISGAALGNRVPAWSSSAPAVATVDADGLVTAVAEGSATIFANVGGTIGQSAITVNARPIATITVTPSPQTIIVGDEVTLAATAFDALGDVLTGRLFTWATSSPAIVTVDQDGLVTGVSAGGPVTISASAEGQIGTAQVTVLPRPPAHLAMATPPSAVAQSGAPLGLQPSIQVQNDIGGPALQAGIEVTATLASGTGVLSGTLTASTDANGLATFTDLVITGPAGVYTIGFSAPGLTGVTSGGVVLGAGGASQVVVTTEPDAAAVNGVPLAQQPVVHLQDAANNPVALAGVDITASVSSGTGTLAGSVMATTDATGTATFTDLAIVGTAPGPFTIDFTAPGLTAATSQAITLTPGAAAALAFATPAPGTASSAVPLAPQPVVRITDSGGNPIAQAGVTVSAALIGGGATLGGTVDVVTDGAGVATFTDLVITGTAGSYQIAFTAPPLTALTSAPIMLGAGTATQLGIVTEPTAAPVNDVVFPQQPVIQLLDGDGNPVAQAGVVVTVAITAPGAPALGGTLSATTDAAGQAAFTNLRITGATGIRTLTFSSGALTPVLSADVDVQPGAATQLVLTTAPSATANNGEVIAQQPVVQVRDVSGNDVAQAGVDVTASATPSATVTLSGATATTDATGAAVFTTLTMTGMAGNYTLTFDSGSLTPATSGPIALAAGTGAKLEISQQPSATAQSGVAFATQPQVRLLDASDNPVAQAGVQIFANLASGGGTLGGTTSATTNASGIATFTNLSITGLVGNRTLLFSAVGYLPDESDAIALTAGPASQVSMQTQPSASTPNATVFAQQPVVLVRDAANNPVSGVVVTAAIQAGGGVLGGTTTATSNASGLAAFTNLMITGTTGNRTLRFTIPGPIGVNASTVAVTAGTATALTITTQPSASAASGVAFAPQPVIRVADVSNNGISGVVVTASINTGGGTLGGTLTATTNAGGNATFTNLSLTGLIGDRTLTFSIAAPALSATSNTVTVTPGAPAALTVTQEPSSPATNDVAFATQPAVEVRDAATNLVPGVVVTASIASGGGTLGGTLTATSNAGGVATFTDLKITGPVGDRVLQFTAAPATVNSATVSVTAGAATQIVMQQQPSASVVNAVAFPQQPAVLVRDVSNNPVSGVTVTAAVATGAGVLGGTLTAMTNASGIAAFTDLMITGATGNRTLSFTIAGPVIATSNTVAVAAGAAAQISMQTQPSASAASGAAFAQQPAVLVRDVSNNPVSGVTVTAAVATGAGVLGGTLTAMTNASGVATFTNLGITGLIGDRTLSFTIPGPVSTTSGTVTITPGPATTLTVVQDASPSVVNDEVFAVQPQVEARDASNNLVPGVVVTASILNGGGTLGGTLTATTDASGVATFTDLRITGLIGDRVLQFSVPTPATTNSATITVTAGALAQLVITQQPSANATADTPLVDQPILQLADVSGNAVAAVVQIDVTIESGTGTLGGTVSLNTDADGLATFTDLVINDPAATGNHTLRFTAVPSGVVVVSATITLP